VVRPKNFKIKNKFYNMENQEEKPLIFGIYRFREERLFIKLKPEHVIYFSIGLGIVILVLHILYPLI